MAVNNISIEILHSSKDYPLDLDSINDHDHTHNT